MRIAFIGLGNMGGPMAANLAKAGHEVLGFDLVPAAVARVAAAGVRATGSVAEAVAGAQCVMTMLPAGAEVRTVYEGAVFAVAPKAALLVDCSTIDVATARAVAAKAAEHGFEMLDAPVSGGTAGATAASLTFMVGGSEAGFVRARPVLERMGRTIVHTGPAGTGQAAKICNNLILGISMIGVSEAFALADRLGLKRQTLYEVASKSSGQCWSLSNYCPAPGPVPSAPANRDYAPGFTAAMMLKDLKLAADAARANGVASPLGAAAETVYQTLADAGLQSRDFSVVFRFLTDGARAISANS